MNNDVAEKLYPNCDLLQNGTYDACTDCYRLKTCEASQTPLNPIPGVSSYPYTPVSSPLYAIDEQLEYIYNIIMSRVKDESYVDRSHFCNMRAIYVDNLEEILKDVLCQHGNEEDED